MVLMFVKQVVATLALRGPLGNWGTEGDLYIPMGDVREAF